QVTGNVTYRVFFTGLPETTVQQTSLSSPAAVEGLVPPLATLKPLNVTDTQYTPTTSYDIGTLSSLIQAVTNAVNTGLSNLGSTETSNMNGVSAQVSTVNNNVNSLSTQISNLNSTLSTTSDVAYAAIAVAIILGIAAIALSRRKPA
ncbi:MAG: hypothetical protein JRN08_06130, partial [Nitrososphaerota archaeon]|nr:hypothetical protein [Nitrososphaerota archaeon]